MSETAGFIIQEILAERKRQNEQFGVQNHDPARWSLILNEEVGEANKEVCEYEFATRTADEQIRLQNLRTELIQVAAVALAFIESLDRNELSSHS